MDISDKLFKTDSNFQILRIMVEPGYNISEIETTSILSHILELMGDQDEESYMPKILSNAIKIILKNRILNFDKNKEFTEHLVEILIKFLGIRLENMIWDGGHDEDTMTG